MKIKRNPNFCKLCKSCGYCRRKYFQIITEDELNNSEFIRAARNDSYRFFLRNGIKAKGAPEFLVNAYMKAAVANSNEGKAAQVM